jgi:GNAT superfamily N-acetyltransferase
MTSDIRLRAMEREDWPEVAGLIYLSTNYWYRANGRAAIFSGAPECAELFPQVYEALDPGCCIVAEDARTGRLTGSCFYHPRPTHVSLGIMNVHPNYFGAGIARRLLQFIIDFAEGQSKPLRLVSSALNLDSFSLYTRAGFVPRCAYQDMFLDAPAARLQEALYDIPNHHRVRAATLDDVEAMAALEMEINHISRGQDYRYFVENRDGIWHSSVIENERGAIDGYLVSVAHPGSNMLGPGVMRTEEQAAALILTELSHHAATPVFLVPVECAALVRKLYALGAKNCELHFAQARGAWSAPTGVVMPTFMPETG